MATAGPTDKQDGADTFKGMQFSLTKEGHSDTCSSMDELEHIMPRETSQPQRDVVSWETPGVVKCMETGRSTALARGWEEEGMGNSGLMQLLFNGYRVVVL